MWKRPIAPLITRMNGCIRKTFILSPFVNLVSFNRFYCDIKTNVELLFRSSEMPTIPSVLKIKRAIKNQADHELSDGFSCIRTKCPACTLSTQPTKADRVAAKDRKDIFINKSTGEWKYKARPIDEWCTFDSILIQFTGEIRRQHSIILSNHIINQIK